MMRWLPIIPFFFTAAAASAAPSNDSIRSATIFSAVGFVDVLDTRTGTTAADDPYCAGQGPTVWYAFTPPTNMRVEANTFGSTYDTTLSVYLGGPGALVQTGCVDDSMENGAWVLQSRVSFDAAAGVTYYFMVGAYASGPGGSMTFSLVPAASASIRALQIARVAGLDTTTGNLTLTATLSCPAGARVQITGETLQKQGHSNARAISSQVVTCAGVSSLRIPAARTNGMLRTGKAVTALTIAGWDPVSQEWVSHQTSATIRLNRER